MGTSTLLIDGDIILYQVSWACQTEVDYGDILTYTSSKEELKATFDADIKRVMKDTGYDDYVIYISSPDNFRKKIFKHYKENRKFTRKPLGYKRLVAHARENHPCVTTPNLEADDMLGIAMTMPKSTTKKATASIDKDMLTIPGRHYNLTSKTFTDITLEQADHNFYMQTLMGDTVDNYKGCPGVGAVKAATLLGGGGLNPWTRIVSAFKAAGLNEADALIQARMARILRHQDYNFDTKEVVLWQP